MNTWNHSANSIFLDAIDIKDTVQRTLFVDEACNEQTHIKYEVLELLKAYEESAGFLEHQASSVFAYSIDSSIEGAEKKNAADLVRSQCLLSGAMLGRYRIERVLGNGGMGIVYLATDTRLGRSVAIKIPRTELLVDSERRIEREARTMASVKHRNLASILDVDQFDGVTFLVMEYVAGSSLSDLLRKDSRISSGVAAELMLKLAEATYCAHAAGIVHRDIKPGNIIIDGSNEPILMDFGLAYSDSDDARMTKSGAILGTPAYMSPEQVLGAAHLVGPHSDVYALGAILYELLTGLTVHQGSASQVLQSLASSKPAVPPSSVQPDIDKRLEAICLKAIANQPSQRFQSARELAEAFHYFLSGDDAKLQSLLGQVRPTWKYSRNALWSLVAIAAAISLGGIYFVPKMKNKNATELTASHSLTSTSEPNFASGRSWSEPERVKFITGEVPATNASISGDGLRIVFMLRREDGQQLCESIRSDRNSAFSEPRPVRDFLMDSDKTQVGKRIGNPWLSQDGLDLILYWLRPEIGTDLYHTHRNSVDSPWHPLRPLDSQVNSRGAEYAASMTQDKLSVFWFRPHPSNSYDGEIWTASRANPVEEFGSAHLLGSGINTVESEQHPCISNNGLLLTFDRGTPDPRLWQAIRKRPTDNFVDAYPIELTWSQRDKNAYCPSLTADSKLLIFTSNTIPGKEGFETGELWESHLVP